MAVLSIYKKARMRCFLSQSDAAELLGISRSYLSVIENLSVNPTQELVIKMARLYEVNPKELV